MAKDLETMIFEKFDEADEWFWHEYAAGTEGNFSIPATLVKILFDKLWNNDTIFTYKQRLRLFRILWNKKIDHILGYDDKIISETNSEKNRYRKSPTTQRGFNFFVHSTEENSTPPPPILVSDVFDRIMDYQNIKTKGEEVLFQRIRDFNADYQFHAKDHHSLQVYSLQGVKDDTGRLVTAEVGDVDDIFSGLLAFALNHQNEKIQERAKGIIDVLQKQRYQPMWSWRQENPSHLQRYNYPIPNEDDTEKYPNGPYADQKFLRDISRYLRSPKQERPEWVGGEFFEREVFFNDRDREELGKESPAKFREAFSKKHEYRVNVGFLVDQGVLKPAN